jgi:hypothetical protein
LRIESPGRNAFWLAQGSPNKEGLMRTKEFFMWLATANRYEIDTLIAKLEDAIAVLDPNLNPRVFRECIADCRAELASRIGLTKQVG